MAIASKSAYLQLFDHESKHDDYSFLVTNSQGKVQFKDAKDDRPMEFFAQGGYKFKKADGVAEFNLETRLADIETDVATNAADPLPAQNQAAIAAMDVAYKAKDAQIDAAAAAEVIRASQAEAGLQNSLDVVDAAYKAADVVLAASVTAEASTRAASVSAEQARAEGVESGLQTQISSLLSNVDPALVDSISELLSHVNTADASLISTIATLQAEHDDLKARVDQLTSS